MNATADLLHQVHGDLYRAVFAVLSLGEVVATEAMPDPAAWNAAEEEIEVALERLQAARAGARQEVARNGLSPRFAGGLSAPAGKSGGVGPRVMSAPNNEL